MVMENLERTDYFNSTEPTSKRDQIKELQARLQQLNNEYNTVKAQLHKLTDAMYK